MLIDWYLPGTRAGGPVRSVYSLVELLRDRFDFYIITTNTDLGSREPYKDVPADTLFRKDGVNYYYFSKPELSGKNMLALLAGVQPDLVYLNSFWSFSFSISIIRMRKAGKLPFPVLLAPRGMLGKGAMSLKFLKKYFFIKVSSVLGWYKGINFHATREQEEKDIRARFSPRRIFVAPNISALPALQNLSVKSNGSLKLFFLSRVAKVKNLHYALEILRDIPPELNVSYDIYGNPEEPAYWARCQAIIAALPSNIKVVCNGALGFDKVQETIRHLNMLFMPTLNENYGHSIVESLLCGCPVIISDQTPWTGVNEKGAGYAISLSSPDAFRQAVIRSAKATQEEFNAMSKAANNYISEKIDPGRIAGLYENIFNECIKDQPRRV